MLDRNTSTKNAPCGLNETGAEILTSGRAMPDKLKRLLPKNAREPLAEESIAFYDIVLKTHKD